MVPGSLPLTRSCPGAVTIASATSALVSDTRVIAVPTLTIAERPTDRRTALGTRSTAAAAGPGAAVALDAAAATWTGAAGAGVVWAHTTVVLPAIASRRMRLPASS